MKVKDVTHQCVMLSNSVEIGFSGKLWCCSVCKDDKGLMKSWTVKKNFLEKKKLHKIQPTCKLFRSDVLPESKAHWGKNMDYQFTGYNKKEDWVYAKPKELKVPQEKKQPVPTCKTGQTSKTTDQIASVVTSVADATRKETDKRY